MKEEKIIRRTVYMRGRPMYGVFATSTFAMYRDESECGRREWENNRNGVTFQHATLKEYVD